MNKIATIRRLLRRRFSPRVRAVLKSACFVLFCVAFVVYIAGFFVIPRLAQIKLQKQLGAAARVRSGSFAFPDRIRLNGVIFAEDKDALETNPILRAERIDLTLHPLQLLIGRMALRSVSINDFLLLADHDRDRGDWNFQRLTFDKSRSSASAEPVLVKLNNGAVKVRRHADSGFETITMFSMAGRIAADPKKNECNFSIRSEGKFGYTGSQLEGVLSMGSAAGPGHLAVTGRLQMPNSKLFGNAWNLENIQVDCSFTRELLELNTFGFDMGPGDLAVSGSVDRSGSALSDFRIKLNNLAISEEFIPNTVVYGQAETFLGDGLWGFLQRFHPVGSGDIDVVINGPLRRLSELSAEGTIRCRDISMQDEKFPYRIEHMKGDMLLADGNLQVGPLMGNHGDVDLVITGTINDLGPNVSIDLTTTSDNMILDDDLYWAIKHPADKRMWTWFAPSGIMGIDNRFQKFPDGKKRQTLKLYLKDVDAIYKNFPYALENLTGTIVMENDRIRFDKVTAAYDDRRKVSVNGQVINFKSPHPTFHVDVDAVNIPLDERLMIALPKDKQVIFDKLQIDARGDFNVRIFSDPNTNAEPGYDYIVTADLTADQLLYKPFPLAMSDVRLKTDVTRKLIHIQTFDARTPGGRIGLNGTLLPQGTDRQQPGFCLKLNLNSFNLDDMFWQAAGVAAEEMLGKLRLTGPVDISGQLVRNTSDKLCGPTDLTIDCTKNPVIWDQNSIGLAGGRFTLQKSQVRFEDFHLTEVNLEAIPEGLLTERMLDFYQTIKPTGSAEIFLSDGFVEMSPDGPEIIDLDFRAGCSGVALGPSDLLHELDGVIEGYFMMDHASDQWLMDAACMIDHMMYRDWTIQQLCADLKYDPEQAQLTATDVRGPFYGGILNGEFKVNMKDMAAPYYTTGVRYEQIDLQRLFNRQTENNIENQSTRGRASGLMMLEGSFEAIEKTKGTFTSNIENLKMGKQSLIGKILTAVQFKQPQDFVFSQIEVDADVVGPELKCNRVRMVGDPLIFQGVGTVNIKEATIDMQFVAWDQKIGQEDTILDMIARGVGSALWRVEMKGDINAPKIDSVYLSVLKQPLDVFGKEEDAQNEQGGNDQ